MIPRSLKQLVKSYRTKINSRTQGYVSECTSISTSTMQRELKGLNSCVALRKPLISEANQKKDFHFLGSIKIKMGQLIGLMSPDLLCSRVMGTG